MKLKYVREMRTLYDVTGNNPTIIARDVEQRYGQMLEIAPDLLVAVQNFLGRWPMSGYDLDVYCLEVLVPLLRGIVSKH